MKKIKKNLLKEYNNIKVPNFNLPDIANNKDEISFSIAENITQNNCVSKGHINTLKRQFMFKVALASVGAVIFLISSITLINNLDFIKNNNPINVTNTQNFTGSPQLTGQTWESTKPSATPSLNKPTPIESNDDKQPYFVEPTLKETVSVDLNGDQQFDKFELYLIQSWDIIWPEGYPEPIYSDEKPYVRAIINDEKYELELIDGIVYGFKMMPFSLGNGNQAVAIEVDLGGSVGTSHLYVVAFSNNKLELLPLPEMKEEQSHYGNGHYIGYDVNIRFLDNYEAEITCDSTNFRGIIPVPDDVWWGNVRLWDELYDENGKLLEEAFYRDVAYPIFGVSKVSGDDADYITINQGIFLGSKWTGLGRIQTTITWDENFELQVLMQELIPLDS